jgi:oxygen-dependent protoporphyrinogen oxidase
MQIAKQNQVSRNGAGNGQPDSMFTSLRGGMVELVEAILSKLTGDLQSGCQVTQVQSLAHGFGISFKPVAQTAAAQSLQTDAVVLATPAYISADLVGALAPQLAGMLRQIRYVSTATVSLGYRRSDLTTPQAFNGFGFMVPKSEKRSILACTWSSTKFNHRAPEDSLLIRIFVGGDGFEHLVEQRSDNDLLALARAEAAATMGLKTPPLVHRIFRWPKGNPQYDVGHLERVATMEQLAGQAPGLYLTGSALRGIGLPDCIKSALTTVDQLLRQF